MNFQTAAEWLDLLGKISQYSRTVCDESKKPAPAYHSINHHTNEIEKIVNLLKYHVRKMSKTNQ